MDDIRREAEEIAMQFDETGVASFEREVNLIEAALRERDRKARLEEVGNSLAILAVATNLQEAQARLIQRAKDIGGA